MWVWCEIMASTGQVLFYEFCVMKKYWFYWEYWDFDGWKFDMWNGVLDEFLPYYIGDIGWVRKKLEFIRDYVVWWGDYLYFKIVWKFNFARKYNGFIEASSEVSLGDFGELCENLIQFIKWA